MKEIHTFKGNFSMFGMSLLVEQFHEIEESIVKMKEKSKFLTTEIVLKNIHNYDFQKINTRLY